MHPRSVRAEHYLGIDGISSRRPCSYLLPPNQSPVPKASNEFMIGDIEAPELGSRGSTTTCPRGSGSETGTIVHPLAQNKNVPDAEPPEIECGVVVVVFDPIFFPFLSRSDPYTHLNLIEPFAADDPRNCNFTDDPSAKTTVISSPTYTFCAGVPGYCKFTKVEYTDLLKFAMLLGISTPGTPTSGMIRCTASITTSSTLCKLSAGSANRIGCIERAMAL